MSQSSFTHFDASGHANMVDVTEKAVTERQAVAEAFVQMRRETKALIENQQMKKGDVLAVAELAGIMAAKKTSDLIPLCHPLPISGVQVKASWMADEDELTSTLRLEASVKTTYTTGVEMEALTACSVAALTVYDMCKAVDKGMQIHTVRLLMKSGGKSGTFVAESSI